MFSHIPVISRFCANKGRFRIAFYGVEPQSMPVWVSAEALFLFVDIWLKFAKNLLVGPFVVIDQVNIARDKCSG